MERTVSASCIHRWILGEPSLGKVDGYCRRCGATRAFPSGLELPDDGGLFADLTANEPDVKKDAAELERAIA